MTPKLETEPARAILAGLSRKTLRARSTAGLVEYAGGPTALAVFTGHRNKRQLLAIRGVRRHQTGDGEMRMPFPRTILRACATCWLPSATASAALPLPRPTWHASAARDWHRRHGKRGAKQYAMPSVVS